MGNVISIMQHNEKEKLTLVASVHLDSIKNKLRNKLKNVNIINITKYVEDQLLFIENKVNECIEQIQECKAEQYDNM